VSITLDKIRVEKDFIEKVVKNISYNNVIVDYYHGMYEEYGSTIETFLNNADRMGVCNRFWDLNVYNEQKVKDFLKTNLCHDKFCSNCKKVKQASRMSRFIPEIEKYKENLYHMVLTQPNVTGAGLKSCIANMFKCFYSLVRYLDGRAKIKGVELKKLCFKGAIRSLEVTFKGDEYHPHLHAGIVLESKLGAKEHINQYSMKYGKIVRKFSEEELLIQKIWYLLINGKRVTWKNIYMLDTGYSCSIDKFKESDYAELFKYMTKETDEENNVLKYDNFKTLYFALYRVRQIQGYGVFYNIKDEDRSDEVDELYNEIVRDLMKKESPVEVS
jgi:hypothetical protein